MHIDYLKSIFAIIYHQMKIFQGKIKDEIINFLIWGCISTYVTGSLLSQMGLDEKFATFQYCGVIANVGLWISFHEIVGFITDIENKKKIYYDLSTPLPSIFYFLARVVSYIIKFSILTILITILSSIILKNFISLSLISIPKFCIIFLAANTFYATWIFFISSIIKKSSNISNLFGRIQFPLWFLGGFQFTWQTLYNKNKIIAYLDLCNPILYINEGFKNAILQITGIAPFYTLVSIIFLFSVVLFFIGYKRLQKQLDFV
jgi:ABC-type multidrug transport system permease subunit